MTYIMILFTFGKSCKNHSKHSTCRFLSVKGAWPTGRGVASSTVQALAVSTAHHDKIEQNHDEDFTDS